MAINAEVAMRDDYNAAVLEKLLTLFLLKRTGSNPHPSLQKKPLTPGNADYI